MRILLTNDDGIHAPGLAAMREALAKLGEVMVVAPATEQSGVGHSITFLTPLMASQVFDGDELRGWAVEGSPADCVKLAVAELCRDEDGNLWLPDLVVSGVNGGLNVGVNVLYSGTVAAEPKERSTTYLRSPCRLNMMIMRTSPRRRIRQ